MAQFLALCEDQSIDPPHPAPMETQMQTPSTHSPRDTSRVDKLAGCTPLAVEMGFARAVLTSAIARHRKAQRATFALAAKPAFTRQRVLAAVAAVRAAEAAVEAKYGAAIPVRSAAPQLLAAE